MTIDFNFWLNIASIVLIGLVAYIAKSWDSKRRDLELNMSNVTKNYLDRFAQVERLIYENREYIVDKLTAKIEEQRNFADERYVTKEQCELIHRQK